MKKILRFLYIKIYRKIKYKFTKNKAITCNPFLHNNGIFTIEEAINEVSIHGGGPISFRRGDVFKLNKKSEE